MAEGEGLLGQQLSAATQIPYENIRSNQTSLEMGLNAWSMATQIKQKRNELEQRMAETVAHDRQLEIENKFTKDRLGLELMRIQSEAGYRQNELGIQQQRIGIEKNNSDRQVDALKYKMNQGDKAGEARHQLSMIQSQLDEEGIPRGTRQWREEYDKRSAPYIADLPGSQYNAAMRYVQSNQQNVINQETKNQENREYAFQKKVGAQLFGNAGVSDLGPVINPGSLEDETKTEGKFWHTEVKTGTGNKKIYYQDLQTGKKTFVRNATWKELTDLHNEWQSLNKSRGELSDPINDPDTGVQPPARTLKERAQRISTDPNASNQAKAAAEKYLKENP